MSLKEKLIQIKKELIIIDRDKIFQDGVTKKLIRSENNYDYAIKRNCEYILSRSSYKAMMAIDRYNKRKEKNKDDEKDNYGFIETI